ncbi:hypothetical protein Y032_0003g1232 [Ancylostoma ceylanicum]|uniref:Uncharacterized protein n=1 Tax=Ancylostoma ceylanicum TaxID=53326 RepID=A0A016VXL7_9BILA|nr:hypothetical protein Y032_0003g1232 [Ancylostoma ceylanicum]
MKDICRDESETLEQDRKPWKEFVIRCTQTTDRNHVCIYSVLLPYSENFKTSPHQALLRTKDKLQGASITETEITET